MTRHQRDAISFLSLGIIVLCAFAIVWHFVSGEKISNNRNDIAEATARIKKIETKLDQLPSVVEEIRILRSELRESGVIKNQ